MGSVCWALEDGCDWIVAVESLVPGAGGNRNGGLFGGIERGREVAGCLIKGVGKWEPCDKITGCETEGIGFNGSEERHAARASAYFT